MATVTFEHVWKRFEKFAAVQDFNIEIGDGEFMVLVGPSGCGKTTALRMIAGLEEITEGTLKIGDRVVNNVAPKDRDIAMVFQSYALYPHMSLYDNMAFGLKLRKVPKADVVEYLGSEQLLHVTVVDHEGDVVAVTNADHRVKPGDIVELKLPLDRLHLFDKESGDAIPSSAVAA